MGVIVRGLTNGLFVCSVLAADAIIGCGNNTAPTNGNGGADTGASRPGSGVSGSSSGGCAVGSGGADSGEAGSLDASIVESSADTAVDRMEQGAGGADTTPSSADASVDGRDDGNCTNGTLKPGNSTLVMSFGGAMRSYILHLPRQYDGKTRLPLVVDMHGKGGTAQGQMSGSGWLVKADAVGIVMIYPQGLYNSWNSGPAGCPILKCCCEPAQDYNIDDAGFIRAAVSKTAQDGCIDLKRVYATGLSNGGCMSHWLGCSAADQFAAVAPVSCGNMIDCNPSRPISVVEYRALQDNDVMYNGGAIGPTNHDWPSAMADFSKWSNLDACTDNPVPMPMYSICQMRKQCAGGAEVILCSPNTGHVLYAGAAQQMAAVPDVAWQVFQRHSLP